MRAAEEDFICSFQGIGGMDACLVANEESNLNVYAAVNLLQCIECYNEFVTGGENA